MGDGNVGPERQAESAERNSQRPLVTFALFAYNQERYISEAIEGAFAQTYEPLEIIISDDCSTDRTFEIVQEMVVAYAGKANIKLNRNVANLGIVGHVNHVIELSTGRLIVAAAGDDISLPRRAEKLWEAWHAGGGNIKYLHSSAKIINLNSESSGELYAGTLRDADTIEDVLLATRGALVSVGATEAWDRELFEAFGPLFSDVQYEDVITTARALALGQTKYVDEPLVLYRQSAGVGALELSKQKELGSGRRLPKSLRFLYRMQAELIFEMRSYVKRHVILELTNRRNLWFYRYFLTTNKGISIKLFRMFVSRVGIKSAIVEYVRYRAKDMYDYSISIYRGYLRATQPARLASRRIRRRLQLRPAAENSRRTHIF
jgi:glycosyltransferase involved in cell wall biosynthesis